MSFYTDEHRDRFGVGGQSHTPFFDLHPIKEAEDITGTTAALVGQRDLQGDGHLN